jgi:hypothetical protein
MRENTGIIRVLMIIEGLLSAVELILQSAVRVKPAKVEEMQADLTEVARVLDELYLQGTEYAGSDGFKVHSKTTEDIFNRYKKKKIMALRMVAQYLRESLDNYKNQII